MKKLMMLSLMAACFSTLTQAQTRVFQQVAEDISTDMETITQDGAVVGYVAFTKLEKINEDSFNYKLSIIDENLNDIGEISLKDRNMTLVGVAFEQDVLCVSFYKTPFDGTNFVKRNSADAKEGDTYFSNQFLTLEGKVIKTQEIKVESEIYSEVVTMRKVSVTSGVKNKGRVMNIPGKGFAFFYGDKNVTSLRAYDIQGNELWKKKVDDYGYNLLVPTKDVIYILSRTFSTKNWLGGYELNRFSVKDGAKAPKYLLEDEDGAPFMLLSFELNQQTGKPFIAGNIIRKSKKKWDIDPKKIKRGLLKGVFSITLNGMDKKDVVVNTSYWSDNSLAPDISSKGYLKEKKAYLQMATATQDSLGNVFFAGSGIQRRLKYGALAFSVIYLPTIIVPPIILGATGTHTFRYNDGAILKQTPKGSLSNYEVLPRTKSKYGLRKYVTPNEYKSLYDPASRSNVIIYSDNAGQHIYNISKRKETRLIPTSIGGSTRRVFGAKEGHIMIVENNSKEKYTKLSIEPI
jgi:hypothetical protein